MAVETTTFYQKISLFWQNNKLLALSVFAIVILLGGIKAYTEISNFVDSFDTKKDKYAEFNRLVQPIYFKQRYARLEDGQLAHLEEVTNQIKALAPNKIIIKSHTSRVAVMPNAALSRTRGEHIRAYMIDKGVERSRIVLVPLGGRENGGLDKGYEQRVEIEIGG